MKIDLVNLSTEKFFNEKSIGLWIEDELTKHGYDNNWFVEVLIVDKSKMRSINKKYCQKDKVTDVLSFPQFDTPSKEGRGEILGNIVLCPKAFDKQEADELVRHSVKHLIGIHHK